MRQLPSLRLTLALVLVILAPALPQASATTPVAGEGERYAYAAGEVLIGWQPGEGPIPEVTREPGQLGIAREDPEWQAAAATISGTTGLTVLSAMPEHGIAHLSVPVGSEATEIVRLETLPWVRYAELNYYAYAADAVPGAAFYPNDPDFSKQWNMHRTKAAEAWSLTRGSLSYVVAVLDTGVATQHPDFAGQLVDSRLWYNYVPTPDQPGAEDDDPFSHGTHVAGIVAAQMNNGQGVAGLAPDVKLLPLKVLNSDRVGTYDAIVAGIYGALDRQAKVINMSLVGLDPSQALEEAVAEAQRRNVLIVAAGGNCAQNPTLACAWQINPTVYPAAYPGVVAVSASDRFDRATIYSGYKDYIDLAAPGGTAEEPVWSTIRGGYGPMYGTSMSTAMVSAAAALVWTFRPTATPPQVSDILKYMADRVGTDPYSGLPLSYANGRNDYFGSGRLNVENAVRWSYPPSIAASTDSVTVLLGGSQNNSTRTIDILNVSRQHVYWQANVLSGAPWLSLSTPAGTSLYGYPAPLTLRVDRSTLPPGRYSAVVHVAPVDPAGLAPVDVRVELHVAAMLSRTYLPQVMQGFESYWLDPDAPGSLYRNTLSIGNDSLVTLGLPFAVNFYGTSQQVLQVSDNGFVILGPPGGASGRAPAECPGDARPPNNVIFVLADDWNPSQGGEVIVHSPDVNTYVVTWRDLRRTGGTFPHSFQLVISSAATFRGNYRTVESPLPGIIGAENYDAAFTQQVWCKGQGRQVRSGESLEFAARLPW